MIVDRPSLRRLWRVAWLCGLFVLLAACAAPAPRGPDDRQALAAQREREQQLRQQPNWSLQGRMAVSGNGDGGSGQLHWRHTPQTTVFEVRAPVSRQTWRLQADADGARLEGLEGGPREGHDAATLIRREIGWELPLEHLAAWVRGSRGDGPARIEFDAAGRPALIEQAGWRIEYRGWDAGPTPPLPTRVFASRGDHRVRLAVARWDIGR